jgi:glycyl-tRNA synthetase
MAKDTTLDTIVNFARRKGFVYPSSEIYGGYAATYDFGPLGSKLKQNLMTAWRDWMIQYRDDVEEIEGAIFLHPKVWEASGHIGGFSDLLVEDKVTKKRYRADHLIEEKKVSIRQKQLNRELISKYNRVFFVETSIIESTEKDKSKKLDPIQSTVERLKKLCNKLGVSFIKESNFTLQLSIDENDTYKQTYITLAPDYSEVSKEAFFKENEIKKNDLVIYGYVDIEKYLTKYPISYDVAINQSNEIIGIEKLFIEVDEVIENAGGLSAEQIDEIIENNKLKSPEGNPLGKAQKFNLLVKTHLGPVEDAKSVAYLKGESCQNIYVDWKQVQETTRRKLPFGIAQLGKAFRNEITVKQFMFRTREFEQVDLQYFVKPPSHVGEGEQDHNQWYDYWKQYRYDFYTKFLNFDSENLKWRQHDQDELVFYADDAWDIEYRFGAIGFKEMEGLHNRTDYDTSQHQKFSGTDLTYLDPQTNERYLPYIVEMSLGVNRLFLATLFEFYTEETMESSDGKHDARVVFKLPYRLAPYKVAILPLMKKDGLAEKAKEVFMELRKAGISADYDETGSIGKRYRRQDENGTPYCITVDYDTLKEGKATLRHRDSMEQEVITLDEVQSRVSG